MEEDGSSSLYFRLLPKTCSSSSSNNNNNRRKETQFPFLPFSPSEMVTELKSLFSLSLPLAVTSIFFYSRSLLSTLFLGTLGDLPLAAGSLAIAFANITGYSVLSGLSLGMEPLCSQSFGANNSKLLSLTLHRSVLFLLCSSLPISFLWIHMSRFLLFVGQDPEIIALAQRFLWISLPDLVSFSFIYPLRIYLRSQGLIRPLTVAAAFSTAIHLPANFLLVTHFGYGIVGVAAAAALSNFALLLFLVAYILVTGIHRSTWQNPTSECLMGWNPLVKLAIPSCVSVCLEWWWYELMIISCGFLPNPKSTVASMGVLIQTTALIYVFPSSLSFGVSTRVGNELGAGDPHRARISSYVALVFSGVMGVGAMTFTAMTKNYWGKMFTDDKEILRLTASALPIVGLCELGNCPQTVGCGVLRGSARPTEAANINLMAFYLVGMPVAVGLVVGFDMGFCGLWEGLLAAQICCAGIMLYVVVGFTEWERQTERAQLLTRSASPVKDQWRRIVGDYQPLISIDVLSPSNGFEDNNNKIIT